MKMKRNSLLALMLASLTAVCLLTACNNGNSDDDDAPAAIAPTGAGTITTLNGKTFVCASDTITMEFSTPQTKPDGSGGTYTKAITTLTNCNYITGTSDTAAKYYSWMSSSYTSTDITYSISGNTITFTWPATTYSSSSTKTATITGGNSFKISGESSSSSGMTYTTGDQVFTEGSAPSSGSMSTSYQ
ncbi:MAG: hypothetical protein II932_02710 [Treponema sp.]|nr:hypothetical protein [Treponema sp.]